MRQFCTLPGHGTHIELHITMYLLGLALVALLDASPVTIFSGWGHFCGDKEKKPRHAGSWGSFVFMFMYN